MLCSAMPLAMVAQPNTVVFQAVLELCVLMAGDALPVRLSQGYGLELVPPCLGPHPTLKEPQADSTPAGQLSSTLQHAEPAQQNTELSAENTHPTDSPHNQHSAALHSKQYPRGAPSLVGATYMGVQGGQQISVGATKQFGFTAEQALQECGRQVTDAKEVAQAEALLRPRAEGLWDPASSWQVCHLASVFSVVTQRHSYSTMQCVCTINAIPGSWCSRSIHGRLIVRLHRPSLICYVAW